MLATAVEDITALKFPVLCTPKLDGFRCVIVGGKALSRSFKPIRNTFVREWLEANVPDGCDGELMLRKGTFSETAGALARETGEPDFVFHVFDIVVGGELQASYTNRVAVLQKWPFVGGRVRKVIPITCGNVKQLEAFEAECLAAGYEGVMIRSLLGPYKCGRSSLREGYLLKWKRFADSEARVTGTYEKMHNGNEALKDAFGRTKRSTAAAGKTGTGKLGGFEVTDLKTGVAFCIGFNHCNATETPEALWQGRGKLVGAIVKYAYQPAGGKDAPRFPTFLGFRPGWDMEGGGK